MDGLVDVRLAAPHVVRLRFEGIVDDAEVRRAAIVTGRAVGPDPFVMLADVGAFHGFTPEARRALAFELAAVPLTAIAVVHATLATRAVLTFIVSALNILRRAGQTELAFFDEIEPAAQFLYRANGSGFDDIAAATAADLIATAAPTTTTTTSSTTMVLEHADDELVELAGSWGASDGAHADVNEEHHDEREERDEHESAAQAAEAAAQAPTQLYYPWAPVTPSASLCHELTQRSLEWARAHALVGSAGEGPAVLDDVDVGRLAALSYPGAPPHTLQLVADFLAWTFVQEQLFADAADVAALEEQIAACVAVVEGKQPAAEEAPLLRALADLRRRMSARADAWWLARFASALKNTWLGGLEEARARRECGQHGEPGALDMGRYYDVRMQSVGVLPMLDLVELAHGATLPPEVVDDPLVHDVRNRATSISALARDVFSYEQERLARDPHNFVHLLTVYEEMSLPVAFSTVIGVHNDLVARFDAVAAELELRSPALRAYVEGLRRLMRGAYDWRIHGRQHPPAAAEGAWT